MKDINNKTLEELEGVSWGEPEYNSHLVTTCHRLRKVPLKDFSAEDLRIMLGQSMGVKYLLPIALNVLKQNPLAQGDYYPGDLLSSVVKLGREVWQESPVAKGGGRWERHSLSIRPEPVKQKIWLNELAKGSVFKAQRLR